MLVNIMLES